jgi:SpoVK/Ycf46/Vps4 family AAA+-type ATPase
MKTSKTIPIIDAIERIALKSEGFFKDNDVQQLPINERIETSEDLTDYVTYISERINCSFIASYYFAIASYLDMGTNKCSFHDLAQFIGQNQFTIKKHRMYFDELIDKNLVSYYKEKNYMEISISDDVKAALLNDDLQDIFIKKPINHFNLIEEINITKERFDDNYINSSRLLISIAQLKCYYATLDTIKEIANYKLSDFEETILLFMLAESALGKDRYNYKTFITKYTSKTIALMSYNDQFMHRKLNLFKHKLIEFCNDEFFDTNNTLIRLTEEAKTSLLKFNISPSTHSFVTKNSKLIEIDNIPKSELFFNEDFHEEYKQLEQLLKNNPYEALMERFKEENLPKALTLIFYGLPGTGKTESVYQLAKLTERNVLIVNISIIKDKFVGESEKRLKGIFSNYRAACKHFDKVPILLFNEADAILSHRINANSSVDMMNNALQNILLQELEDFEGILIATTNHIKNLDKAYDRRFLYKLHYKLPNENTRAKIWQAKVKKINIEQSVSLGKEFTLSGGQINNIARKVIADELLFDKKINTELLQQYCQNESDFRSSKTKIGF